MGDAQLGATLTVKLLYVALACRACTHIHGSPSVARAIESEPRVLLGGTGRVRAIS